MEVMDLKLCDIQGRLFEMSVDKHLNSQSFVECFMLSDVAKHLDALFSHYQWAGEEYLMEVLKEECGPKLKRSRKPLSKDEIYWIGYIYRYWHYYKKTTSKRIYKVADFERLRKNYLMFHTLAPEMAIDNFIEIHRQEKRVKL